MAQNNLPKTGQFFVNARGNRNHVRHYHLAAVSDVAGSLFFFHGYGGHANLKAYGAFAEALVAATGLSVFMIDHESHGYSGPADVRCAIADHEDLVADCVRLVHVARGGSDALREREAQMVEGRAQVNLGLSAELADKLAETPFFVSGQSMGGAVALLVALHIQDACRNGVPSAFRGFSGAVLVAPALNVVGRLPAPLEWFMSNVIAWVIPTWHIPAFLDDHRNYHDIWPNDEMIQLYKQDPLGFPHPIRWCSASAIIGMCNAIALRMGNIACPFLVLHDPEDKICPYESSETLLEQAQTESKCKALHPLPGMLHDLVTNCGVDKLVPAIAAFAKVHARTVE